VNPILLMSGVNSVLQLGRTAKNALAPGVRAGASSRFEEQLSRAISDLLKSKDADRDGALSLAEVGGDPKVFSKFDTDGNGKLTANELRAWYASQGPGSGASSAFSTHA
jgi:Ca2+-binding EF-hand superfamily protein